MIVVADTSAPRLFYGITFLRGVAKHMAIRSGFFDVDGTTINNERRNRRAIEMVASVGGHEIQPDDWNRLAGHPESKIWHMIAEDSPQLRDVFTSAASFETGCLNMKLKFIDQIERSEEIATVIQLMRSANIPSATVSNSIAADAGHSLKHVGYTPHDFLFQIFRDDIEKMGKKSKPYPDPYLLALDMLNERLAARATETGNPFEPVKPPECLVFEDTRTGVTAALSAGMHVIHITDECAPLDSVSIERLQNAHGGVYHPCRRENLAAVFKAVVKDAATKEEHCKILSSAINTADSDLTPM